MPESITPQSVARKTSLATGRIREGLRVHALVLQWNFNGRTHQSWQAACGRDVTVRAPSSWRGQPFEYWVPGEGGEVWLGLPRAVTCERCIARMK